MFKIRINSDLEYQIETHFKAVNEGFQKLLSIRSLVPKTCASTIHNTRTNLPIAAFSNIPRIFSKHIPPYHKITKTDKVLNETHDRFLLFNNALI